MLSCKKKNAENCIKENIKYVSENVCGDYASVAEHIFQGETAYTTNTGNCPDNITGVIDSKCNSIGFLGGFGGNDIVKGVKFSENSTFVKYHWKNY